MFEGLLSFGILIVPEMRRIPMHKIAAPWENGAMEHWPGDIWRHANYVLVSKLPPSAANPPCLIARRTTRIASHILICWRGPGSQGGDWRWQGGNKVLCIHQDEVSCTLHAFSIVTRARLGRIPTACLVGTTRSTCPRSGKSRCVCSAMVRQDW